MKKKVKIFEKEISVFLIVLVGVMGLASASLLTYFGVITGTVGVTQGLLVDGKQWDSAEDITYFASLTSLDKEQTTSGHLLDNQADVDAAITLTTECTDTGVGDCEEVHISQDTVGLSTTIKNVAGADASATLDDDEVTLMAESDTASGTEARITINAQDVEIETLADLGTISWDVDVNEGYIAHVDVIVDKGGVEDALVFEYAKYASDCDNPTNYPAPGTMGLHTFGTTHGEVIDGSYLAWLSSGDAGPGCTAAGNFYINSLTNWKSGYGEISGTTKVLRFEIEVDAWGQMSEVTTAESVISNIEINGQPVAIATLPSSLTVGDMTKQPFYINSNFPRLMIPDDYTITTTVEPTA